MNLTDGTLTLRALEPTDTEVLYRWENDPTIWKDGATIAPFSRTLLENYITEYNPDIFVARQLRFMMELSGSTECIGTVDLYDFDPRNSRAGVGILVDAAHRGKGYGCRALEILAGYCRNHIGIHQLYAVTGVNNIPSRRSFEKGGFRITGRLKSWIKTGPSYTDAYFMQRLLV